MNNKKLENIAEKVLAGVSKEGDDDNFGFVVTVLIIISIILTLIRVIQECNKTKLLEFNKDDKYSYFGSQIKDKSETRSWLTKRIIKKAIRKELSSDDYKKYGTSITNAILDTGVNLTDDEIITLVEAANV